MGALLTVFYFFRMIFPIGVEAHSFEVEMGPTRYIETREDRERLTYYQNHCVEAGGTIPKRLHVIWLGASPFPKESQKVLQSWIKWHGEWELNFWTDQGSTPVSSFRLRAVTPEVMPNLWGEYLSADNEAERAALLRLELLDREGGLIVDCDAICLKAFDTLHETLDFYSGLKPLKAPIFSSSIQIAPHILASKAGHPLIKRAIDLTKKSWSLYGQLFPQKDIESIIYRVQARTQLPLNEAIYGHLGPHDAIFPASTFHKMGRHSLADHLEQRHWIYDPSQFFDKVKLHLDQVEKGQRSYFYLVLGLSLINFSGSFLLLKRRRSHG